MADVVIEYVSRALVIERIALSVLENGPCFDFLGNLAADIWIMRNLDRCID